ncbi:hypothetical protein [Halomarina ordinaria]|uniref:CopG family transcriptional regulator n=1 Tax=Halomarina ordinaria TaxID=3033939 RepID=A0ABD5U3V8_9EURY|nr:hypothetical protein [Halomarina sp. PSRA2]
MSHSRDVIDEQTGEGVGPESDGRTVTLPTDLYDRVDRRVPGTEFETVDAYVRYVMEEVLLHVEREGDLAPRVDEAEVRSRLRSLGYLDE